MRKARIISLREQKRYLAKIEILMDFLIDEVDIKNEIGEDRKFLSFDPVKYTTVKNYISAVMDLYYQ
jgi:hypothetical protein